MLTFCCDLFLLKESSSSPLSPCPYPQAHHSLFNIAGYLSHNTRHYRVRSVQYYKKLANESINNRYKCLPSAGITHFFITGFRFSITAVAP